MSATAFSVIIPTKDRPGLLALCLEALARQDFSGGFEVIVVDDGGAEPAAPAAEPFRRLLSLVLLRQANAGPSAARNAGAAAALGDFLAFTDDDCTPDPGWLTALSRAFAAQPDRLVGGRTFNALPENPYSSASQLVSDLVHAHYNADADRPRFFPSNNMAVRADLLNQAGGFDPSFRFAEDRELCDRWLHQGRLLAYEPGAVVRHAHRLSLPSFLRQHFGYGQGAYDYHKVRAGRGSGRFRRELRFHARLPGLLRRVSSSLRAARAAVLLVLWQAANAAGFFAAALAKTMGRVSFRRSGGWL